jgi:hypothetical protein
LAKSNDPIKLWNDDSISFSHIFPFVIRLGAVYSISFFKPINPLHKSHPSDWVLYIFCASISPTMSFQGIGMRLRPRLSLGDGNTANTDNSQVPAKRKNALVSLIMMIHSKWQ